MKNSIQVTPNSIQLSIGLDPSKLSNRQRAMLNELSKIDLKSFLAYVESFKGKTFRELRGLRSHYDKMKVDGHDTLASKRPSSIIKLLNEKFNYFSNDSVGARHVTQGMAIGVEIECLIPRFHDDCPEHLCDEDDCCDGDGCDNYSTYSEDDGSVRQRIADAFRAHKVKNTLIKGDGSLTDDERVCGIEIVTILRADDLSSLERICNALKDLNAKVDKTCGLHVHLDARIHNHRSIVKNLKNALPLLKSMVPATRVNNYYCQQDVSQHNNRYAKINTTAYKKHRTIEVRLHSGTTDFTKISQWITVLRSIALSDGRIDASKVYDVQYIADKLSWSEATMEYVAQRQALFAAAHNRFRSGQSVNAESEAEQAA